MTFHKWALVAAIGAMASFATPASAVTFNLTSDHCTGGCGTAPFGTVDVTQSGANVIITVDLAAGYSFVQTGAADEQYFKFNATGVVLGDISFGTAGLQAAAGAFNGDGTGSFGFGINNASCGQGGICQFGSDIITFTIANATIADVTGGNDKDIMFVADVLAPNGNTGPVDVSVPGPIFGAGLPGLVMACGGLLALARRRRRQIA